MAGDCKEKVCMHMQGYFNGTFICREIYHEGSEGILGLL